MERAQRSDRTAFLELYQCHAPASWRLAVVVGRDLQVAEEAVTDAFAQVLGTPDRREVNRPSVGAQLLQATRESAIDRSSREATSPELSNLDTPAHADTVRAFDRLPERWRSVLWLREVEELDLATSAAVLGMTEQSTDQLSTRALGGLREQFAQAQLSADLQPNCQRTTIRLSGYVAGSLSELDTGRVRRHLDRCENCRVRLDEVDDLAPRLRPIVPVLPIAIEAFAVQAWLARANEGAGPLGLRLPSGRLVPAWIERSLAGATAAVVSLGITSALMLGARDDATPARIESADGSGDGEQAFRAELPGEGGTTDGTDVAVTTTPTTVDDPAGSTSSSDTGVPPSATPRAIGPSGGGGSASGPRTAPSASPSTPPSSTPPPSSPPSTPPSTPPPSNPPADPVGDVVDVVDDVVDDACTALGLCSGSEDDIPLPEIPGL